MKILLILVVLPVFCIMNWACSKDPANKDQIVICFGFQDLETEYWVAAHSAITKTLESLGIKVIEKNAHQDANRQLEQIRDAIAQNVDGIIIIPQDGESALTIIGEANNAGIPIGVFTRNSSGANPWPKSP